MNVAGAHKSPPGSREPTNRTKNLETVRYVRPQDLPGVEILHAHFVNHKYAPHLHETWTVATVDVGAAAFELDGVRHVAPPGSVFLIPPHAVHTGESATPGGYHYRVAYLDPVSMPPETKDAFTTGPGSRPVVLKDEVLTHGLNRLHAVIGLPGCALEQGETLHELTSLLTAAFAAEPIRGRTAVASWLQRLFDVLSLVDSEQRLYGERHHGGVLDATALGKPIQILTVCSNDFAGELDSIAIYARPFTSMAILGDALAASGLDAAQHQASPAIPRSMSRPTPAIASVPMHPLAEGVTLHSCFQLEATTGANAVYLTLSAAAEATTKSTCRTVLGVEDRNAIVVLSDGYVLGHHVHFARIQQLDDLDRISGVTEFARPWPDADCYGKAMIQRLTAPVPSHTAAPASLRPLVHGRGADRIVTSAWS
jgi:hypothetical protein